jgi:phosphoenolpyruvate carboxykinase (ATP)
VGRRIDIAATRAMVHAALSGELAGVPTEREEVFGLAVPQRVPGVDAAILRPQHTWPDPEAYQHQARKLAAMFAANFAKNFQGQVSAEVASAGPH